MHKTTLYIFLFVLLTFNSCAKKQENQRTIKPVTTLKLNYAEGFSVLKYKDYKEVIVYSPWKKGEIYARYYLVKDEKTKTPVDGVKIKIPLKNPGNYFGYAPGIL